MGLNIFALFVGFGLGSLGFGALLEFGFVLAFSILRARNCSSASWRSPCFNQNCRHAFLSPRARIDDFVATSTVGDLDNKSR
jgi:hypothetical protein